MSVLTFDIGSSQCKAILFSASGKILGEEVRAYTYEAPRPSFVEIGVERFWEAICGTSRALKRAAERDPVEVLAMSSHAETFVPVAANGAPVGPAILNMDHRASAEAGWLEQKLGKRHLYDLTGLVVHPMFPIPKTLWLRDHQPETYGSAVRFLNVTAYLLQRLGLPPYVDYSLASRFLAFDVRRQRWSEEILSAADLEAQRLPIPVPAGTVAGKLGAEAASQLGVAAGTQVVVGGHDQACGALGAGAIAPGRVADSMGTYECLTAVSAQPASGDVAFASALNVYCHVVPGMYLALGYFPSGIMVQWFHDLLLQKGGVAGERKQGSGETDLYDWLESRSPQGPSGLLVTPHLIGTCNPDFNPRARAAVIGLSGSSDAGQIYKGILEGLAFELAQIAGLMAKAVGDFTDLYVTGGGSRSPLGLKLRAALTRRRLHVMQSQEAVCLGTAILAGAAAGIFASIPAAVDQVVRERRVIEPDLDLAAAYSDQARQYAALYSAINKIREIGTIEDRGEQS
jgi:xylulokinase